MTWTVSRRQLNEGVSARRRHVGTDRPWVTLEMLARGLRWAGEAAESRRLFGEAALDLIARDEREGLSSGASRSRIAGFFALAGEHERARLWGLRAASDLAPHDAVATLYVCGEPELAFALALAREYEPRTLVFELLQAERCGDLERCDAAIQRLVARIAAARIAPCDASGGQPIDDWDWLELCFAARTRITGERPFCHAEILERTGLAGRGPSLRVARLCAADVKRFPVTSADNTWIVAAVDRRNPDFVRVELDPRPDHYLVLAFDWIDDDQGYVIRVYTEPLTSPADVLPYEGRDFREAVVAAADWLDGMDVYGRDGSWAARTLLDVAEPFACDVTWTLSPNSLR
jgi:hypothetical protein